MNKRRRLPAQLLDVARSVTTTLTEFAAGVQKQSMAT